MPCPTGKALMSPTVGLLNIKTFKRPPMLLQQIGQFCTFLMVVCFLVGVAGMQMQTWSECTRKMIDAEFERREENNYNCFLT